MKIGYKVIDPYRMSVVAAIGSVKYPINRWVKPNYGCGPLAVFDELYQARRFIETRFSSPNLFKIVKCKYEPSDENMLYERSSFGALLTKSSLPVGTVLAKRVKCLE